jgi:hypothetical protein
MVELHDALRAWGTAGFAPALKRALEGLAPGTLPLDGATAHGGRIADGPVAVTIQGAADAGTHLDATIGVFFAEVIAGCSCGDEPFDQPGYCELLVRIDKATGAAAFTLIPG